MTESIYLFVVSSATLSGAQASNHSVIMNRELEWMLKEAVVTYFEVLFRNLREVTEENHQMQDEQTVVFYFWRKLSISCLKLDSAACLMPAGQLEPTLLGHASFIFSLFCLFCSHSRVRQ